MASNQVSFSEESDENNSVIPKDTSAYANAIPKLTTLNFRHNHMHSRENNVDASVSDESAVGTPDLPNSQSTPLLTQNKAVEKKQNGRNVILHKMVALTQQPSVKVWTSVIRFMYVE